MSWHGLHCRLKFFRCFEDLSIADVPLLGGRNASRGEMYRELTPQGIRVPNGFAITAQGYRHVLDQADAWPRLHAALDGLDARCRRPGPPRATGARDHLRRRTA